MTRKIKAEQLSDVISEELRSYRDVVDEGMRSAVRKF